MSDPNHLRESLVALSQFFVGGATLHDTLLRVAELAEGAVPQSEMTGLTMMVDGRPATAIFTDPEAPEIDAGQYEAGDGPCLTSFRTQEVIRIDDTTVDQRWPHFCEVAVDHGIRSTLSLPLVVTGEGVGAMNMYARVPFGFDDDAASAALGFAVQAGVVLANAQAYWDARLLSEQLSDAMSSRASIEQAKGILMAQSHVRADAAFDLLVRASQRENRKVRDIAADLIERVTDGATAFHSEVGRV